MGGPHPPTGDNPATCGAPVEERATRIEYIVSVVLRYGVLLSFLIILIGSLLLFLEGGRSVTVRLTGAPVPNRLDQVLADLLALRPRAIIDLGLMLLIATPVLRVAVSVIAFLVEDDLVYTAITLFVLAVLLTSFFLGAVE
ncbi:MAG TPA: DUF1634 domain-containing protein [Chloroflexota bacterium]|nr:DUF1634 domain-containing protein [Chloroflexota bacterium]